MVPRRPGAYDLDGNMLRRLRIENLVLIQEAELTFAPGLNAITGETGAGKTMVVTGLLLLGSLGLEKWVSTTVSKRLVLTAQASVHSGKR